MTVDIIDSSTEEPGHPDGLANHPDGNVRDNTSSGNKVNAKLSDTADDNKKAQDENDLFHFIMHGRIKNKN